LALDFAAPRSSATIFSSPGCIIAALIENARVAVAVIEGRNACTSDEPSATNAARVRRRRAPSAPNSRRTLNGCRAAC
jgi:hypothetical protein